MDNTSGLTLVTCCGGYCGGCAIHNGQIRDTARALKGLVDGWGYADRAKSLASSH